MGAASIRARPPSTVWALLTQWYGSWLKTRRVINDFTVTTTAQRICTADPSRVLLQISNNGTVAILFGENRNISTSTGLTLAAGAIASLEWFIDLDLQTTEIWAIASSGSQAIHVVESLLVGEFETAANQ